MIKLFEIFWLNAYTSKGNRSNMDNMENLHI